jgi:integrase
MLNAAVDDGLIVSNPAAKLGRQLRITASPADREEVKAMTREQLFAFLVAAREREPRWFPLLFTAARTGLRLRELLALRWEDVDYPKALLSSEYFI